jgi:hypothetical protein
MVEAQFLLPSSVRLTSQERRILAWQKLMFTRQRDADCLVATHTTTGTPLLSTKHSDYGSQEFGLQLSYTYLAHLTSLLIQRSNKQRCQTSCIGLNYEDRKI